MIQRPTPTATARVALPIQNADIDTDEEVAEEGEVEEIDDGDFLADFPDNTDVRCYFRCIYNSLSNIPAIGRSFRS